MTLPKVVLLLAFAVAFMTEAAWAGHDSGGGAPSDGVTLEMITTNLAREPGQEGRLIQVGIQLKLGDPKEAETVKAYMPKIRSEILYTLCDHTAASLSSGQSRIALLEELQNTVNTVLGGKKGKRGKIEGPVEEVLFTYFLIP